MSTPSHDGGRHPTRHIAQLSEWSGAELLDRTGTNTTTLRADSLGGTFTSGAGRTQLSPNTVSVNSVTGGGLVLNSDAAAKPTNLNSTQTISIPELVLPLFGLAVLAPVARRLRRGRGLA